MKWLRNWLRRKLGVVAFEETYRLGKHELEVIDQKLSDRLKIIEDVVNVGVDVHMKSESWAVVCIAGENPYVVFYRLGSKAEEVQTFLNEFKRAGGSIVVDAPMGMSKYFKR